MTLPDLLASCAREGVLFGSFTYMKKAPKKVFLWIRHTVSHYRIDSLGFHSIGNEVYKQSLGIEVISQCCTSHNTVVTQFLHITG